MSVEPAGIRRFVGSTGQGRRPRWGSAFRRPARTVLCAALLAFVVCLTAAAGASAFEASGSAKQVDVTGLPPNAQASLLKPNGTVVATKNANSNGGLLFREVAPGPGYKVRLNSNGELSGKVTVHSNAATPWDPSVYDQSIPDNGYTYLTTRDGTQLAISVHPPTSPADAPAACPRPGPPCFRRPWVASC